LGNLLGSQIDSVEVFSGVMKPMIAEPKYLSTVGKAINPFIYYRTSNIYVFPYKMSYEKLINLIGGRIVSRNRKTNGNSVLGLIGDQSNDFIVDI
jgi:hypothetical protein